MQITLNRLRPSTVRSCWGWTALLIAALFVFSNAKVVYAQSEKLERVYSNTDELQSRDRFLAAISLVTKRMAKNYAKSEANPISIDVLDMDAPGMAQFVNAIMFADTQGFQIHSLMSLTYENTARVNGRAMSACLLMYNSKKREETLASYESFFKDKSDILYYLAAHEFGHCMAMHQSGLGNLAALTPRQHELFADKVAVAFFLANGKEATAQKILDFNSRLISEGSEHHHPQELNDFMRQARIYLSGANGQSLNMYDLYKIAAK